MLMYKIFLKKVYNRQHISKKQENMGNKTYLMKGISLNKNKLYKINKESISYYEDEEKQIITKLIFATTLKNMMMYRTIKYALKYKYDVTIYIHEYIIRYVVISYQRKNDTVRSIVYNTKGVQMYKDEDVYYTKCVL